MLWGPEGKQGAVLFSFDNMGEAAALEFNMWPAGERVGFHPSVFQNLPFILDTLQEFGLETTFCIEAWNADHYPDAVRAIADAGHNIAIHGYRHETWFALSEEDQIATITRAHAAFQNVGVTPRGYRPPGGVSTAATERVLADWGYTYVSPTNDPVGHRNGLAVLSMEPEVTDVAFYTETFRSWRYPHITGATDTEAYLNSYRHFLDKVANGNDCRSPLCHVTTMLDTDERKDTFRRIVEMTASDDRIWATTCEKAADWVLSHRDEIAETPLVPFQHWDPRAIWNTLKVEDEKQDA